jgi:hypothetical protein
MAQWLNLFGRQGILKDAHVSLSNLRPRITLKLEELLHTFFLRLTKIVAGTIHTVTLTIHIE